MKYRKIIYNIIFILYIIIYIIYYAKKYHGAQKRRSGEPFYSHPLAVAEMVAPYCFKTDILVTSILHDTIEDTELTKEMISYIFGPIIASQVDDLTRIKIDQKISAAEMLELLYVSKKYDLLLVKIFDRLHNMRTLNGMLSKKIEKIKLETLKSFMIVIIYLGLIELEQELKHLCKHKPNNVKFDLLQQSYYKFSEDYFRFPALNE